MLSKVKLDRQNLLKILSGQEQSNEQAHPTATAFVHMDSENMYNIEDATSNL